MELRSFQVEKPEEGALGSGWGSLQRREGKGRGGCENLGK